MTKDEQWLLREKYHGVKTEEFLADCERLAAGEPLGYVIGFVPFLDCQIWLDSRPLIPRPETEYWTEQAIKAIQAKKTRQDLDRKEGRGKTSSYSQDEALRVLDLCAGSGAIGVAVAKAVPEVAVTFVELDPTHLPTIKKNLEINLPEYSNRLDYYPVITSDLFAAFEEYDDAKIGSPNKEIRTPGHMFDFILTNPPYIDSTANTVEASVTENEPHLALFGGKNGMEVIERIIKEAPPLLTPLGQLWIEHEPFQVDTIKESAATHGYTVTHHPDQYGTVRYSVLIKNVPE